jgi:hypothetical protein
LEDVVVVVVVVVDEVEVGLFVSSVDGPATTGASCGASMVSNNQSSGDMEESEVNGLLCRTITS